MDTKTYKIDWETSADIAEGNSYREKEIRKITLNLESSTSRAGIFNLALKLAAIDWQDPIHDIVEKIVNKRVIDIATGKFFRITCEKHSGPRWETGLRALTAEDAQKLIEDVYPYSKVIKVEEIKK